MLDMVRQADQTDLPVCYIL